MSVKSLTLEVLSGPLDGAIITLAEETDWCREGTSRLAFPWDIELGQPQARFIPSTDGWHLEGLKAKRGTHIFRRNGEESLPIVLEPGDILNASCTWLLVRK